MHQPTILATLALSLLNTALALPRPTYAPAPYPPFRLPQSLRTRQDSIDCALDNLTVPFALTTPPLAAPDTALTLASIVIGRGVQNYTCPTPSPSNTTNTNTPSPPTANGAIAILYDASCFSTTSILANLATSALPLPLPSDPLTDLILSNPNNDGNGSDESISLPRLGHHYFDATKTPVFDFSESAASDNEGMGVGRMKVDGKSNAPVDSVANVPWLVLGPAVAVGDGEENGQSIRAIYRVETRGGVGTAGDCEGKGEGEEVSVEYAAEYWVFVAAAAA